MAERRVIAAIVYADMPAEARPVYEDLARHFSGQLLAAGGASCVLGFNTPSDAVQCAWEAQQRLAALGQARGAKTLARMALHLGEVVTGGPMGLYGGGVDLAARLLAAARPGGICLSGTLAAEVRGRLPYEVRSLGEVRLPGLPRPVEAFELPTGREEGSAAAADALIGRQVGPCRLERLIGKGGMGSVYLARHLALDRPMAVKVLSARKMSAAAADRLIAEARSAAAVEDPRVVRVYDAGRQGELSYVVMQLIEGETLEARVARGGPLKPEEARAVVREVLRGLSAAHKKGVVHRDVKPANIMLCADGSVKILDFGLAGMVGGACDAGEAPAGSFDFMPPEQGFDAPPDPRQDLYALGSTWFYALAGLPPFSAADAAAMLLQHREAPVPDVRAANREVTSQAAELLKQLMDKDPARRPASADAVLAELDAPGMVIQTAGDGSPFTLLPPPPGPQVEGLAADPVVQAALRAAPQATQQEPDRAPVELPPPPPELPPAHRMEPAAKALLAGLFAVLFGRHWAAVGREDLLGLALSSAGALLTLALADGAEWARRSASSVLYAALAGSLWLLAAPASSLGVEVAAGTGLGLVLGAAGLVLGFWTGRRDRPLGCALLAASALVLLTASAGAGLPDGSSWASGVPARLSSEWAALRATGGLHRWAGVAAALFCGAIWRTSC